MYILYKHLVENVANLDVDTDTVIKYVEFCRNVCDPNAGFIKQIREFEEKCRSGEMKEILDKYHENNQQQSSSSESDNLERISQNSNEESKRRFSDDQIQKELLD